MAKKKKPNNNIEIPNPMIDDKMKFSLEFYDDNDCEYCISKWDNENFIRKAMIGLKEFNKRTINDLNRDKRTFNFHPVDWSKTIKKNGFPDKKINQLDAYQFSLIGVNNQQARVFGAISKSVFYIVWFDLNHEICPVYKKNT